MRVYVGESKGAQDFAKQFLEKRSQRRNKARQPVEVRGGCYKIYLYQKKKNRESNYNECSLGKAQRFFQ